MNNYERQQLDQFLQQLIAVRLTDKDQEAERLISEAIMRQPDAAYLLVQKSLLQDQALQAAQTKINDLQQQMQQQTLPAHSSGFLNSDPWATASQSTAKPADNAKPHTDVTAPMQHSFSTSPAAANAGFGSSFLGNVATTAAGVVAGSFLFQGIGSLLGHHQSGFAQQAFTGQTPEQTVVNNYYGDNQTADEDSDTEYLADNDIFFDDSDSDSDWV